MYPYVVVQSSGGESKVCVCVCCYQVHLCEAIRMGEILGDDFLLNRTGSRSMMVAVKMLRTNADDHARSGPCTHQFTDVRRFGNLKEKTHFFQF